ncbi:rRNA maturation RNase YbeY [Massilibacterium senegalense]|uniref:rRNA maturation RNase YbeY n=1 Tax=Massilibacterium senegalense TaxID=1632858 RepID=UPI0007812D72|nr:rRNA maturation RNase YbeY [Massilibacterium senegalense]
MNVTIDLIDEVERLTEEHFQLLSGLIEKACEVEQITEEAELSITFVDNKKIHQLNQEYRGIDRPTDVLSFALEEMGEEEIEMIDEEMPRFLGDLIISIPKVEEQAKEYGHSFERELGFLAVHGFLHLLGYDHMTEEEEKEMFAKQEEILHAYGLERS